MRILPLKDKINLTITTLFGIGFTPIFPGTASCVLGVLFFLLIKNQIFFLIFTVVSLVLAFSLSTRAEVIFGEKDCKKIVIDDFAGMLVALLFIPQQLTFIVVGFFVFRMLDLLKIPPADRLEKLSGAKGIVGDDLVAGVYTNIILHAVIALLKILS